VLFINTETHPNAQTSPVSQTANTVDQNSTSWGQPSYTADLKGAHPGWKKGGSNIGHAWHPP